MRRNRFWQIILIACLAIFLFEGCVRTQESAGKPQGEKLSVYTSFYPLYDFTLKMGGDKIELVNLVPSGSEPHDWEPTAADIAGLEKADVFIYNGAGMEHWVEDVLASLSNESLIVVEAAKGVPLLKGHAHEEDGHEEDGHDEAENDPHVWLDPMNAKIEMENIKNALQQADPGHTENYEANYAQYALALDALDQEFQETLSALPNQDIIVTHQAFGYLCDAYGLNQVPVEGLSPDSEPDPARVAEIISFAQAHHVRVIFFEELVDPKVAETIAAAIGAETGVLSPLEGLSEEQEANGDDYFSVMRQNLKALEAALQ